ncbi:MAG: RdgB/HAM1 family non-canonical purine NTP pyrophosphatase [Deltaproteobacteria bacterium]|nr:RdgB/HAM1 family non-canonical purine NTP pyrophosphatase [Deltaproteobacteria bacterium]
MKVVVATRNRHKVREIAALLAEAGLGVEAVAIDEVAPRAELVEEEDTFEGNALAKARQAAAACGLPAMADDSGIEVDALFGAPGVRSARWAGEPCDDGRNNQKMLRELANVPAERRTARYRCAAAFVDPARSLEIVRSGACEGVLLDAPRGSSGFGYDPLFLVPSLGQTMAEIDLATKNRLSHRAAAFGALALAMRKTDRKK